MVKYNSSLDATFSALSDPTRRAIISQLCERPASVGELAEPFELSLPMLLKHIRILENCGLVTSKKVGRVRTCSVQTEALKAGEDWMQQRIAAWESRLDRMEAHISRPKHVRKADDE